MDLFAQLWDVWKPLFDKITTGQPVTRMEIVMAAIKTIPLVIAFFTNRAPIIGATPLTSEERALIRQELESVL